MTDTHRTDSAHDAASPAPASDGDVGPVGRPEDHAAEGRAREAYTPEDGRDRDVGPGWPPVAGGRGPQSPWTGDMETPTTATGVLRLLLIAALVAAIGLRFGLTYPVIIGGIVLMIFLHELGHFLTAKWSGMKVTEFFIGFGPRIWSFHRGETEYGLKVIPAGAYVRIIGMNNLDEADPTDEARTYRHQSFPKRLLVVSAGSISHLLQAFVLLVIAVGLVGVPGGTVLPDKSDVDAWEVIEVTPDSAADEAGLRSGDEIVAVNGRSVQSLDGDLGEVVTGYDVGDTLELTLSHNGRERTVEATVGRRPADVEGPRGAPFLGVKSAAVFDEEPIGVGRAVAQAPGEMVRFAGEGIGALASFFSPDGIGDYAENVNNASSDAQRNASDDPAPPREGERNRLVSIYGVVRMGADLWHELGVYGFLLLFFQINMFIGIFNMLPLPPLDGGHAAVAVYERVRSRRGLRYHADVTKLLPVTYAVVMGLVLLGVTSLYLDIVNPPTL